MSFLLKVYRKVNINLYKKYSNIKFDPGSNLRYKILNLNEGSEEMNVDDQETDFMDLHQSHIEHITETEAGLAAEKFRLVKQKYFKEKNLNFLTWHDKQQIRYLYTSNPEEWTIEKLSEGFPVLPENVKKIVKSKWTIKPSRITKHDLAVQKNWENFRNGQISNLSKEEIDHLNKFTNRTLNFKPFEPHENKNVININMKSTVTQFSQIITSYNELKAKKGEKATTDVITITSGCINKTPSLSTKKKTKSKPLTLHQLHDKIENELNNGKELTENEKLLLKSLKFPADVVSLTELKKNNFEELPKKRNVSGGGSTLMVKQNSFSHLIYPEKIMIPKNICKKGYTYKLNDCYYDDDGLFLYRVPGMD